jgi:hypothetical protein
MQCKRQVFLWLEIQGGKEGVVKSNDEDGRDMLPQSGRRIMQLHGNKNNDTDKLK